MQYTIFTYAVVLPKTCVKGKKYMAVGDSQHWIQYKVVYASIWLWSAGQAWYLLIHPVAFYLEFERSFCLSFYLCTATLCCNLLQTLRWAPERINAAVLSSVLPLYMSRSSAVHCCLHIHELPPINLNKQSKMSKISISLSRIADFCFLCPPHHIYPVVLEWKRCMD